MTDGMAANSCVTEESYVAFLLLEGNRPNGRLRLPVSE